MARDDLDAVPAQPRLKQVDCKVPARYLSLDAIPPSDREAYDQQMQHADRIRAEHASRNQQQGR